MARRRKHNRSRVRRFRDIVTEGLIDRMTDQAELGKCKDAVRSMSRVGGAVSQPRERERFRAGIMVVARRCAHELAEELASRAEIAEEVSNRGYVVRRGEAAREGLSPSRLRTIRRSKFGPGKLGPDRDPEDPQIVIDRSAEGHGTSPARKASPKIKRRGKRFLHLKRTRKHRGREIDVVDLIPEE